MRERWAVVFASFLLLAAATAGAAGSESSCAVDGLPAPEVDAELAPAPFAVGTDTGGAMALEGEMCGCWPLCACDSVCRRNGSNGLCACYWEPGNLCCWDTCGPTWWGSCSC